MNDLTICKKIAEIEGETVSVKFEWDDNLRTALYYGTEFEDRKPEYNPLTDDALLWRLAKKYRVSIEYFAEWQRQSAESDAIAHIEIGEGIWCAASIYFRDGDDSLNKAICLAIIEAHKDNNNE